ncbi:hypothetical protein NUSPORA_00579 [Nucleospora cyclopteri]
MVNNERSVEWVESESEKSTNLPSMNNDTAILEFLNDVPLMTQVLDNKEDEILMNLSEIESNNCDLITDSFDLENLSNTDLINLRNETISNQQEIDSIDMETISFNSDSDFSINNEEVIKKELIKLRIEKIERKETFNVLYCKETTGNNSLKEMPTIIIRLFDNWRDLQLQEKMVIKILQCRCCNKKENNLNIVDNDSNLLLIESDMMTVTNLINSFDCSFKGFLQPKIADINFKYLNRSLVIGTAIHKVLQEIVQTKCFDIKFISQRINMFITENVLTLYRCNITEKELRNEILKQMVNILDFSKKMEDLEDIEFCLISDIFNLKGNIDILCKKCVVEVKTGKYMHVSHRAQVLLYSLMLAGVTEEKLKIPIIFYTLSGNAHQISVQHSEIRDLIIKRNRIVLNQFINRNECNCSNIEPCAIFNNIMKFEDNHFLKKQLINLVETAQNIQFYSVENCVFENNLISFNIPKSARLEINERIYIYNCNKKLISKAQIKNIENCTVYICKEEVINTDQKLYFSTANNELFRKFTLYSIINIAYYMYIDNKEDNYLPGAIKKINSTENSKKIKMTEINTKFNEDKLEFPVQNNLKYFNSDISSNYSSLQSISVTTQHDIKECRKSIPIPDLYKSEFFTLNEYQQSALLDSLNCNAYRIIHGMPGTGKSTLIVLLIKILIFYRKKILLICYTHLALDNLLHRLSDINWYKTNSVLKKEKMTVSDLSTYFNSFDLIAGTCYSFHDPVFVERTFDFCIIDEGSQINLLLTLIPLSISRQFVIVGDHLQINPIQGEGISLFEHLYNQGNFNELKIQYRMGNNIMKLSNQLFYDNKMQQGTKIGGEVEFIDSNTVKLPDFINNLPECSILCYFNSEADKIQELTNNKVVTIDKFQGSESDVIVVVFDPILANDCQLNPNRLNVALTRAKKRMILYGNIKEMKRISIFKKLLDNLNV